MCIAPLASSQPTPTLDTSKLVNLNGDVMSPTDAQTLVQLSPGDDIRKVGAKLASWSQDAQKRQMFLNWLTAGGKPAPLDPGKIFSERSAMMPIEESAAKGMGFNGLFGMELPTPGPGPLAGGEKLAPLNLSPLQPGVPYSVPAVPKVGGNG